MGRLLWTMAIAATMAACALHAMQRAHRESAPPDEIELRLRYERTPALD